jgi:hypothetical protein
MEGRLGVVLDQVRISRLEAGLVLFLIRFTSPDLTQAWLEVEVVHKG